MATSAAVLSLISGLGGSAIGAIAAIYVPLRQMRRQIRETERERSTRLASEEIIRLTSLRFSGRAWVEVLLRTLQSLEAGQAVSLERFDEETKEAGAVAAREGYRVIAPVPTVDDLAGQIYDALTLVTWLLRQAILEVARGEVPDLSTAGRQLSAVQRDRAALNALILERIEELVRSRPDAAAPASIEAGGTGA